MYSQWTSCILKTRRLFHKGTHWCRLSCTVLRDHNIDIGIYSILFAKISFNFNIGIPHNYIFSVIIIAFKQSMTYKWVKVISDVENGIILNRRWKCKYRFILKIIISCNPSGYPIIKACPFSGTSWSYNIFYHFIPIYCLPSHIAQKLTRSTLFLTLCRVFQLRILKCEINAVIRYSITAFS